MSATPGWAAPAHADNPFDHSGVIRDDAGIKRYLDLPASLVELLHRSATAWPDREAVVEVGGGRLTYRALWSAATRVSGGLAAAGVRRGDRVAIRYSNGVDWVLAFFGTLLAGAIAVPINTRLTEEEVRRLLEDCTPAAVLGPSGSLPDGLPTAAEPTRDDPAAIFYTSGTTGAPKGALLTHENVLTTAENGIRVARLPSGDPSMRTLISIPLFHVAACNNQLIPTLQTGGAAVILGSFEVGLFLTTIEAERIRVITSVPAIYWAALNRAEQLGLDLGGVGWATYGGAPISPELVGRIKRGFRNAQVGNGFGLTESSSVATFLPDRWAASNPDSVGFPVPTVDLRLAETDSAGVGELLIRGGNVIPGYWRHEDAPATRGASSLAGSERVGSWLATGDLARIDDSGLVYIVDRLKDMINRGGENVYCTEVENALAGAPGVAEAAVIGVPDPMMGEKVGVVLVPMPGATIDLGEIVDYARQRLADFKVPQAAFVHSDPLPRNAGGKILKPLLRQITAWERL